MNSMALVTAPLTVEQFLELPEEEIQGCELVDGEIVSMSNAAIRHERVKANFNEHLVAYNLQHRVGSVFPETIYRITPSDSFRPDLSLLLTRRLTIADPEKIFEGAPELAVEVVSSERAAVLDRKIKLYLENGSRAVWVAYPESRTLQTHRADGVSRLKEDQHLEEPQLLPGFRVLVSQFFEGV